MKFDVIIGNPPYQEQIGSEDTNSSLSKQLFPSFIKSAIDTGAETVALITPSRWFAGDAQDKSFLKLREYLKEHNHIRALYNYQNGKEVFPNTEIKGGVNYFLYDKNYTGKVKFVNVTNGVQQKEIRNLFEEGMDIVISDGLSYGVLAKIKDRDDFVSFTSITKGRNAFGIIGKESVLNSVASTTKKEGYVELRCKADSIMWIEKSKIAKNADLVDKYKVFISKSAGSPGKDLKVIGYPYVGGKNSACTDSLIPVGAFENKDEAINLSRYMKTKFLRFVVSIVKMSQNVTQIVYQFVPMQDFTNESDIKWSANIANIDIQLFKKYGLSDEEISYIDANIKEME